MMKLVGHHSCGADRLPVAVRFPAGPRVRLQTADSPKGNGLGQKIQYISDGLQFRDFMTPAIRKRGGSG